MTNAFRGCITSKPTSEKSHFSVRQMGPDDGEIFPGDPTLRALQGRWGWDWGELPASPFLPSSWVPPLPLRTEEEIAAALWFPHLVLVSSLGISISQAEHISVCLGCCNKTPHHGWLANRSLFLTVLEAGPSEIKALTDLLPGCFHGGSAGKESACSARDPSLIPGSGRPPGEGIGCPLQYSWASLVAQMVKNPPAMQETWVRTLGRFPGGRHGNLQYSCPENPHGWKSLASYSPWGHKESDRTE